MSCHFGSLSMLPAADGDHLTCKDMGRESDSMLSLTLIFRNFPGGTGSGSAGGTAAAFRLHMRPSTARRDDRKAAIDLDRCLAGGRPHPLGCPITASAPPDEIGQ